MYEKLKNSMCNDIKTEKFSSKTENKARTPILPYLFNIVPEDPAKGTSQEKWNIEDIQNGKEKVKLSLLADGIILNTENSEDSFKNC